MSGEEVGGFLGDRGLPARFREPVAAHKRFKIYKFIQTPFYKVFREGVDV